MTENIVSDKGEIKDIAANNGSKTNFFKEFLIDGAFLAVGIAGIVLGFLIDFAEVAFLGIGVVALLLGASLLYSTLRSIAIVKRLENKEFTSVSELQKSLNEDDKDEVLNMLEGFIKNGHLIGIAVSGGEEIIFEAKAAEAEVTKEE